MELVISVLCILNGIHLSKTEVSVLAHYMAFGVKETTDDLLLNSKILNDTSSLRNMKTRLKKLGFLKRTNELYKSYELNTKDSYKNEDVINMLIKIDNT
jgi:hypothetical protein